MSMFSLSTMCSSAVEVCQSSPASLTLLAVGTCPPFQAAHEITQTHCRKYCRTVHNAFLDSFFLSFFFKIRMKKPGLLCPDTYVMFILAVFML